MSSQPHTVLPWVVRRTRLPLLSLRCVDCRSESATTGKGRFRVNANGKLLDVWLLVRCVSCDRTSKLTVHERAPVRSFDPAELDGYHASDPELVASRLLDPLLARRNRFTLDWKGAWRLDTPSAWLDEAWPVQVESSSRTRCRCARSGSSRRGSASAGTRCCAGSSATFRCAVRRAPGSPLP
jgi:Protein of unknown function (DUF1062)